MSLQVLKYIILCCRNNYLGSDFVNTGSNTSGQIQLGDLDAVRQYMCHYFTPSATCISILVKSVYFDLSQLF